MQVTGCSTEPGIIEARYAPILTLGAVSDIEREDRGLVSALQLGTVRYRVTVMIGEELSSSSTNLLGEKTSASGIAFVAHESLCTQEGGVGGDHDGSTAGKIPQHDFADCCT